MTTFVAGLLVFHIVSGLRRSAGGFFFALWPEMGRILVLTDFLHSDDKLYIPEEITQIRAETRKFTTCCKKLKKNFAD